MASLSFNANDVAPSAPREVLPPGEYLIQAVKSDVKPTRSGNGTVAEYEYEILDGQFKGRRLWDRFNMRHENAQAQEIGQRQFSALCHAAGVMNVSNTEQLHFKPVIGVVKVRPAGPDKQGVHREAQNEFGGYKPRDGKASPPPTPAAESAAPAAAAPPAAASSIANAPWKRRA